MKKFMKDFWNVFGCTFTLMTLYELIYNVVYCAVIGLWTAFANRND